MDYTVPAGTRGVIYINYVIEVQYRHPASHIDGRYETKKVPLEVIFQKSCFRPKNRPKRSKNGVFFAYFDYSIAFLFVTEYFIFVRYMKAHIYRIGAAQVTFHNFLNPILTPRNILRAFSTHEKYIINPQLKADM